MLQSLIVGFGRAGKDLHLHCLRKLRKLGRNMDLCGETVGVVDPKVQISGCVDDGSTIMFQSLVDVRGFDPRSTVVHICTPPRDHLQSIRELAELGYTKIIVEKPLAVSMRSAEEVLQLRDRWNLDLCVVAVWLSSTLTGQLRDFLQSREFGEPSQLTIEQYKPRFSRALLDTGHCTAFEVELPHQVALALYLGGQEVQVTEAVCTDMKIGATVIPFMGTAEITLHHSSGLCSYLVSDLTAPSRKRFVRLGFERYILEGYFPASGEVCHSCLTIYDRNRNVLETKILEDDPLTTFFQECYCYYAQVGPKPVSDLPFNIVAVNTLTKAKLLCGIPVLD